MPINPAAPESTPPVDESSAFNFLDTASRVWHATLFTAGDQQIKLNQIIIAVITMLIGLYIAKRLTMFFIGRLNRTNRISENVAETLSKIIYYVAAAMVAASAKMRCG